jgi:hypothetical protein
MDESTQQNAAMVEQANAAAASMNEQAARLSELTAFFKFEAGQMRVAQPPTPASIAAPVKTAARTPRGDRRAAGRPWQKPPVPTAAAAQATPPAAAAGSDWSAF